VSRPSASGVPRGRGSSQGGHRFHRPLWADGPAFQGRPRV
jgi:hypothetical protein